MKRKIFFLLLIVLNMFQNSSRAQLQGQDRLDSLLQVLKNYNAHKLEMGRNAQPDDTNTIKLLVDIGLGYSNIKPDEGIKYGEQGLALAEKLGWKKGMGTAMLHLGVSYDMQGNYAKALENYSQASKIFEELNLKDLFAAALQDIGIVYRETSDYVEAVDYLLRALKISGDTGSKQIIANTLNELGNTYYFQKDYSKASEYYLRAEKINKELEDKDGLEVVYSNLGLLFVEKKDYSKSLEYCFKALKLNEELNNKNGVETDMNNISMCYLSQKEYAKALEYVFKSFQLGKDIGDKYGTGNDFATVGAIYQSIATDSNKASLNKIFAGNKLKALEQAKFYTDSAIAIDKEINNLSDLSNYYKQLSDIENLLGDTKGSLESYKNYTTIKDSVFNTEKDKKLTQKTMQYEFDKKEDAAKAEQDKKDIQQRNIRNSIAAGFAGTLAFLVVVYRQRNKIGKEKKKSDAEKQRSEELLLNILPAEVAMELKTNGRSKAKAFTMVTVMFTDFKDFTAVSEKISAELLVDEIHHCFSAFDNILHKYNIEKIKTIGDAYLCASGLPVSNHTHAVDMINCAFEIRSFMLQRKKEKESKGEIPFELRIGIHTGPVVAGIVGVKKYAYDIWGDTVNLAARMEQNSEAGKINISGSTYELVKDKFKCEHRGKIDAKNKGQIDMYFVSE